MSLYEKARRAMASLTDAPGFLSTPVSLELLDEMIADATGPIPERFAEPPWSVVAVVGEEREHLITQVAEALARHWGLGSLGPRGLASDKVLSAPALLLVFSTIPSAEGLEAFGLVAGAVQNLILLAHAAGLATHRIYSPHVVPEAVLDFVGLRLGPEIRGAELVAMLAVGYPSEPVQSAMRQTSRAVHWIGRPDHIESPPVPSTELAPKPAHVLRALRSERVLVVDPYPYNRELIANYLVAAGYEVKTFSHGQELVAAAASLDPALFVVAESLPDTSGFELVRRLQSRPGLPAPIIITTARRDTAFRISGLAAGVDYYLRKPVNAVELYTAVRILLDRYRLVAELRNANSELERLLGELRATQARLVQQAKMASLGQLVAGVAHEINTPLAAVVSNNDLFLRTFDRLHRAVGSTSLVDDPKIRRELEAVVMLSEITRDACRRITGIVRTLRTFARLDEADVKAVDLHEGIESTLMLIAHLIKAGITIDRRYGGLPKVECHPNQINQVFMNLLVNACQALDGCGRITIETSLLVEGTPPAGRGEAVDGSGDRVRVCISDTGRGIPSDHLSRVFDPGFTTKGAGVGTGLGLSICYQIVEAHGGEIEVQSQPGEGASFIVTLPVHSKLGAG